MFSIYSVKEENVSEGEKLVTITIKNPKLPVLFMHLTLIILTMIPWLIHEDPDYLAMGVFYFGLLLVVLGIGHTKFEVKLYLSEEKRELSRYIHLGGIYSHHSFTIELDDIKFLKIIQRQTYRGRDLQSYRTTFLSIELPEKIIPASKNRLGLKTKKKIKPQSKDLFISRVNTLFQVTKIIQEYIDIQLKWELAEVEVFNNELPVSCLVPDQKEVPSDLFTAGFHGEIKALSPHDPNEKLMILHDRDRGMGLLILSFAVFGVLIAVLSERYGWGAPTEESEEFGFYVMIALFLVFAIGKLLDGYRRTYFEIKKGESLMGWELFGLKRTTPIPTDSIKGILLVKKFKGRHRTLIISEKMVFERGFIPDKKKGYKTIRVLLDAIALNKL